MIRRRGAVVLGGEKVSSGVVCVLVQQASLGADLLRSVPAGVVLELPSPGERIRLVLGEGVRVGGGKGGAAFESRIPRIRCWLGLRIASTNSVGHNKRPSLEKETRPQVVGRAIPTDR
jgi:hypothetical protein